MTTDSIKFHPQVDTRRYWTGVMLFIAALIAAIVLVIFAGSNISLHATITPAPNSTVSTEPEIRVQFARSIDKASIENHVFFSPALSYQLAWQGDELRILPDEPLLAEADYTVTIGPGIRESNGNEIKGKVQSQFRTRQPRIVYTRFGERVGGELWISDFDGSNPRQLSNPEQSVLDYDGSPDGSTIIYTVEEELNTVNLWRTTTEQGEPTRLTDQKGVVYGAPRFSPSGELLVVEVRQEIQIGDQGSQLSPPRIELRRPTDGSPAGQIYGGQGNIGHTPRWSPDGTRIAFYEANTNALGLFNFTSEVPFFPAESAFLGSQGWAPDGRSLVYSTVQFNERSAQQNIVVRDLELGTELSLGEDIGDQADPAWHPDGSQIAYAYRAPPTTPSLPDSAPPPSLGEGIWLMRPNGTGKILLLTEAEIIYSSPLWSPDGEWLLFGRFDLNAQQATQSLWIMRRDGTDLEQVSEEGFQFNWIP